MGIPEYGQYPVALPAHEETPMAGHHGPTGVLQRLEQCFVVLHLEGCRQMRRTVQVGKQHRHEVTLGSARRRGMRGVAGGRVTSRRLHVHRAMIYDRAQGFKVRRKAGSVCWPGSMGPSVNPIWFAIWNPRIAPQVSGPQRTSTSRTGEGPSFAEGAALSSR